MTTDCCLIPLALLGIFTLLIGSLYFITRTARGGRQVSITWRYCGQTVIVGGRGSSGTSGGEEERVGQGLEQARSG